MHEGEPRGVQAQPPQRVPPAPVRQVAHDRMARGRELGPELAAPPGHEPELERGRAPAPLEDAVARHRLPAPPAVARDPDPAPCVRREPRAQRSVRGLHAALDDRDVHPLGAPRRELRLERPLRGRRLREHDQPRGLAVEPVDDEDPAALLAGARVVRQHAVRGPLALPLGRDREEPGGLVHDEDVPVLVDQRERRRERGRRRDTELDAIAGPHGDVAAPDHGAVDADARALETLLEPAPRRAGVQGRQALTEGQRGSPGRRKPGKLRAARKKRRTVARSSSIGRGFLRQGMRSEKRSSATSGSTAPPVMNITRRASSGSRPWSSRKNAGPSSPGMRTSIRTRSNGVSRTSSRAVTPLVATVTRYPSSFSTSSTTPANAASSSTTRMDRAPAGSGGPAAATGQSDDLRMSSMLGRCGDVCSAMRTRSMRVIRSTISWIRRAASSARFRRSVASPSAEGIDRLVTITVSGLLISWAAAAARSATARSRTAWRSASSARLRSVMSIASASTRPSASRALTSTAMGEPSLRFHATSWLWMTTPGASEATSSSQPSVRAKKSRAERAR